MAQWTQERIEAGRRACAHPKGQDVLEQNAYLAGYAGTELPNALDEIERLNAEVARLKTAAGNLLAARGEIVAEGGIITGCSTAAVLALNAAAIDLADVVGSSS